ncbi:hypothetical protein IWW38_000972 [Coemansia aciculifera]|uniref:Uncharacterized protein n=1 Tax=Coemansia aciculifera TaxID=417176 RepID=A0ACC1M993_9FUNG|nr:hypothetical protein IWW38_000972 [Coemansia aciculifera]
MVCAICFGSLFDSASYDESDARDNNNDNTDTVSQVAALSCGHTFHLECINLWLTSGGGINMNCPMCNVDHVGSVLALHIECDLEHVVSDITDDLGLGNLAISDPLRDAESLCNSSLDLAEQQQAKYAALQAKARTLQVELNQKKKQLQHKLAVTKGVTKKAERLEDQAKELVLLSERHKVHILSLQRALDLKKQDIAGLEDQIRNNAAVGLA